MRRDTRIGVQTMALVSLLMQLVIAVAILSYGGAESYLYTVVVLGIFSLHILISAAYVDDVRALQVLGMSFLTIGAMAITFLAHRAGDLNIGMMAAIIMLFVAIPLVPWALREAVSVVGITYVLLTSSLISVPGRFATGSLWVLQILLLGSAIVVVVVAGRNTFVRKQDIRARFELENARNKLALLSMQDHLTGAWNRRYLDENFATFAEQCARQRKAMHIAVLDIDDFKGINDEFGHQLGDRTLVSVADTFIRHLDQHGSLIRLGGDEFLIIYCGDDLDGLIDTAIRELQKCKVAAAFANKRPVTVSAGIASTKPGQLADLEALYRLADRALYATKRKRPPAADLDTTLARTGQWQL